MQIKSIIIDIYSENHFFKDYILLSIIIALNVDIDYEKYAFAKARPLQTR
ncbi:hypothetical protein JCM19297_1934 [Nonlabens ulvanivorans]|nr:hypothetical protein [Nonlabens ulvanivorans]GAK90618.1 hypothetical protein JCM19297_1934 [Nonlabens ulvanivorans]